MLQTDRQTENALFTVVQTLDYSLGNSFFDLFEAQLLFPKYFGSGGKIQKTGTAISSFFISLSVETTPTKIGRKLWDHIHVS
jgi:hypothetical protein